MKIIMPKSAIINGNIKNYSAFENHRIDLVVNIGYDDYIGVVRDLLMGIMTSHPNVLSAPSPTV